MTGTKLYDALAGWWPLLSAPEDYAEEAELYRRTMTERSQKPPRTVLELGSGGGNNASHLKQHFDLTLVDVSPGMLDVSAKLNPECEHVVGDMRSIRLKREFDCVFVHDAVAYMTTEADLRSAMVTAYVHCRPGGIALFVVDDVTETYTGTASMGGHDGPDGRGLRYLEWNRKRIDGSSIVDVDYAYLLRAADGQTTVVHDRHECGLFSLVTWQKLLADTGFSVSVKEARLSEPGTENVRMFVCRRPG